MKKEYELPRENNPTNQLQEPAVAYGVQQAATEMMFSPPLTEEELKECMTGEEFIAYWCKCIDKVFDK